MIVSINKTHQPYPEPRYTGRELIIAIDSSKSNTAIAVADECGELIDYIELNGREDGTTEEDVLTLCYKERKYLQTLFRGAKVRLVGIENIISKVDKEGRTGMTEHLSRFKITSVFMSFISFFQDNFGITAQLINNQEWKAGVLPEEYRKRKYDKGSLAYFKAIRSVYASCSDDVTDSICILWYLCKINDVKRVHKITSPEVTNREYKKFFAPESTDISSGSAKVFIYNPDLSLEQNEAVMVNNLKSRECGVALLSVEAISIVDILKFCHGQYMEKESSVYLVVQRS